MISQLFRNQPPVHPVFSDRGPPLPTELTVRFAPMTDGLVAVASARGVIQLNPDADPYTLGYALLREARRFAQRLIGVNEE